MTDVTLLLMSRPRFTDPETDRAAMAIRRRIREVGHNQTTFASEVGRTQSWVSSQLLVRPSQTLSHLAYKEPEIYQRLLRALNWTTPQLNAKAGLNLPIQEDAEAADATQFNVGPLATIRDFGTVSAGEQAYETNDYQFIELPEFILDGYNAEDCFALTVVGNSMTDDGTRDSIIEGSIAVFHEHLHPEAGEIVAAWLDDPEYGELRVLKVHRPDNGFITLHSFNHQVKPIVISPEADFHIFGVYLGAWNPGPRLRHRNGTRSLKARVRYDLRKITGTND